MSRPHLLVSRPLPSPGPERLAKLEARVTVLPDSSEDRVLKELHREIVRADAVLTLLTETIDRRLLARCPNLRGIANMAVGFDNLDVAAATELGIPVSTTPGVLSETTADLTWAALLAVARRLVGADRYTREGRFQRWGADLFLGTDVGPGPDAQSRVLGLVGYGRIGQAVARRAAGFSMEVLAHDPRHRDRVEASPHATWAEFDVLLHRADFVSLHLPLTAETRHRIGAAELAAMRPSAYLINTSRGPIVDELALVEALRAGEIAGAALDVFENEPRLAEGLAELDSTLLLPHIGSASHATRGSMATTAVANAAAHLAGQPAPDVINPEVYGTAAWRARIPR